MDPKPVLFLLPGLLCDSHVWHNQQLAFSNRADIRIPDFKGIDSLETMADMVLSSAPETFLLAGHSMGGRVALELVNKAPERIKKMMLLSVGAHPVDDEECEQRSSLVEEAASIGMDKYASNWADLMLRYQETENQETRRCIESMARRQSLDDFIAHITAGLGRQDQTLYLPHINIPVQLVVGQQDTWSPVAQHEAIRQLIPGASMEIVPNAGHMVILDQPACVNDIFKAWFF